MKLQTLFASTALLFLVSCNETTVTYNHVDQETAGKCLEILRSGIQDKEFWPSIHAAEGLTLAGHGDEVIKHLKPKLTTEKDQQQLCGVARELVRAGEADHIKVMADILMGEEPYAHIHAAESLFKVHSVGDLETMKKAFAAKSDIKLTLMAAAALIRIGETPEPIEAVRAALASDDPEGIRIGAWILGRVGEPSDIERLRPRIAAAPDPVIKAYVQHALAALGDPAGLESLRANTLSPDPAIRTYAATFAGDVGDIKLIPVLIPLLDDSHPDVRYRAAQSILQLAQL